MIRHNKIYRSNIKKIFCILLIILLVAVAFNTTGSSSILRNSKNSLHLKNKKTNILNSEELRVNLAEVIIDSIKCIKEFRSRDFLFTLHTNYAGIEKTNKLTFIGETKIDVNNDGSRDIGARLIIYPFIAAPFSLSINFKLIIRRLNNFPDENENFEIFAEFSFPGLLIKNLAGEKIKFGYQSEKNELIPKRCAVTYTFVPNFILIFREPDHLFSINPDCSSSGKTNLNLLFGFIKTEDDKIISSAVSKIKHKPIVKSKILYHRTHQLGKTVLEYERKNTQNTKTDLFITYKKDNNETNLYSLNFPKHVTFTINLGKKGLIAYNTFNKPTEEIGICDDLNNPENKVFFSNIFTLAKIEWDNDFLFFLRKGKAEFNIYTEGVGTSFNVHLEGEDNGVLNFNILPQGNIIDCKIALDISQGYFRFYRNQFDILFSFNLYIYNETYADWLSTIEGAMVLNRIVNEPFEIIFENLENGEIDISLSGKGYEISNFEISGFSKNIGGNFSIEMDRLFKQRMGNISFNFITFEQNNNLTGKCRFDIQTGVEISNLSLLFENFKFFEGDVGTDSSCTRWYNFSLNFTIVEWHIEKNLKSGYILIKGGSNAWFRFNSTYDNGFEQIASISGEIGFKTTGEVFNISWKTIEGKLSFNINGTGLARIGDFHLWLKDKAEIYIPEISASFNINTIDSEGDLIIYLDSSGSLIDLDIAKLNFSDSDEVELKATITADLSAGILGEVVIAWNESGITQINGGVDIDVEGTLIIEDFLLRYRETLVNISFDKLKISGNLNVNITALNNEIIITANGNLSNIDIINANIYTNAIFAPNAYGGVATDINITFSGHGIFTLTLKNDTIILDGVVYDDSDIVINSFWFLVPEMFIEINFENLIIYGPISIIINLDTGKEDIPILITFIGENDIVADIIYAGYSDFLQIFVRDFIGDLSEGWISFGFNILSSMPVIDIKDGSFCIGYFNIIVSGLVIGPFFNISIDGSAKLEVFLDLLAFQWVYLKGEVTDDTLIILGDSGYSILLEPGNLDLLFQNNLLVAEDNFFVYLFGYSTSLITLHMNNGQNVTVSGIIDLWIDILISDEGRVSAVIDAKEVSGILIISDLIRLSGEINAFVDFSVLINKTNDTLTISDFSLNIEGEATAVVQIKVDDTTWIPIIPFTSSGQVIIFSNEGIGGGPNLNEQVVITPKDNSSINLEIWFTPPINRNIEELLPLDYYIDFGDGTNLELNTNDTEIYLKHIYEKGEYDAKVIVNTSDPLVDSIEDSLNVKIVPGDYLSIIESGRNYFLYSDVEEDGRIHTWFRIKNNALRDYDLNWEAYVDNPSNDEINWTIYPENGILTPNETALINVSFIPPIDGQLHDFDIIVNNTDYDGYSEFGADDEEFSIRLVQLFKSVMLLPLGGIYLPDIDPNESISASFWIWNDPEAKGSLNWSINEIPEFGDWSFSKTSGYLPVGGTEIVQFTVTAPDEHDIDLTGDIKVVNLDVPEDNDTITIYLNTRENDTNLNVEIREDEESISIKIGGYNEVHIDEFSFTVNNNYGMINGDFIFVTDNSFVFINWTKDNIASLSIDGNAEFTISNFAFFYSAGININISRMITGGLHFSEGRKGNVSIAVDDTFVDVDVNIILNHNDTNLTLSGNINIDIDSALTGSIWFDWDLEEEPKNISIDSNLFGYNYLNINITNLIIKINNFTFMTDRIFFNRTVDIFWNETNFEIISDSIIEIENIYLGFEGNFTINTINANLKIDGQVLFSVEPWGDGLLFCINSTGFTLNGILYVEFGDFYGQVNIWWTIIGKFCIGLDIG